MPFAVDALVVSIIGLMAAICSSIPFRDIFIYISRKSHPPKVGIRTTDMSPEFDFHHEYVIADYVPSFHIHNVGKFNVDVSGLFIYLNIRLKQLIGEHRKDLWYKPYFSCVIKSDRRRVTQRWKEHISNHEPIIVKHRHSHGRYCITEAYPVYDSELMWLKGFKGITVRISKRLYEELDEDELNALVTDI
jgi:hypothetical protein